MQQDEYIKEELSETGRQIGIEDDDNEDDIFEPFDPSKITIESKITPMDTVIRRLKQGTISLSPSFQRNEVWNVTKKSLLIESLMLSIPLPMFYVAEDEQGKWEVVDGLQRLSAIRDFLHGNKNGELLKLQNLEFLGERFNNKTFKAIESDPENQRVVNMLLETELRFTIIKPGTPEAVKRNIFKRINTGGMPLTAQEIRHALYEGESTKLLSELVNSSDFEEAIGRKINDSRMGATELVLRLVSFMIFDRNYYKSGMDSWLSNAMLVLNSPSEINQERVNKIFDGNGPALQILNIEQIKQQFSISMKRAHKFFGRYAFRKSLPNDERLSPVNKSLFEVWGNILGKLNEDEFISLMDRKELFLCTYSNLLQDVEFVNLISRYSSTSNGIQSSFLKLQALVNKCLGKEYDYSCKN